MWIILSHHIYECWLSNAQIYLDILVQFSRLVVSNSLWPHRLQHASLPCPLFPVHCQLPEPAQAHVHQVGDVIQPSHLLLSPSPPAFDPSQHQGLFHWVHASHWVAKVLELQLQHQSLQWIFRTNQYALHIWSHLTLIKWPYDAGSTVNLHFTKSQRVCYIVSFRMDWLDLLAVQGTLKSLFQHHSSKVSILRHSALFLVQLSHPYIATGKPQLWLDRPLSAK